MIAIFFSSLYAKGEKKMKMIKWAMTDFGVGVRDSKATFRQSSPLLYSLNQKKKFQFVIVIVFFTRVLYEISSRHKMHLNFLSHLFELFITSIWLIDISISFKSFELSFRVYFFHLFSLFLFRVIKTKLKMWAKIKTVRFTRLIYFSTREWLVSACLGFSSPSWWNHFVFKLSSDFYFIILIILPLFQPFLIP